MRAAQPLPQTSVGIVGRGDTLETCYIDVAKAMFSLMADIERIHQIQILTFEFDEPDLEKALNLWLTLLIDKSHEHHLLLGDFRLKHEGTVWKATVAGEPWQMIDAVKNTQLTVLSVIKCQHHWEARCFVNSL